MSNSPRVMLVDDDRDLLRLLSTRLSAAGYEVTSATSGEAAREKIAHSRPQLIFTDLQLDRMDGMTLFDHERSSDSEMPLLVMTAHSRRPDAFGAVNRGALSYLTRPYQRICRRLRTAGRALSLII